ncbi:MAG: hypothetical protein QXT14_02760 [Candidatus Bathyarchaeia archaeon]
MDVDLKKYDGKVIMVVAEGCKPCDEFRGKAAEGIAKGLVVVVTKDDPLGRKLAEIYGGEYPIIVDIEVEDGEVIGCKLDVKTSEVSCRKLSGS